LKGDLGGNLFPRFVLDAEFAQFDKRPVQTGGEALEKDILRHAQFAGEKREKRLLRAVGQRHLPGLSDFLVLIGEQAEDGYEQDFYRIKCHKSSFSFFNV